MPRQGTSYTSLTILITVLGLFVRASRPSIAWAQEFQDEVERDFPLRSIGNLFVTNLRGGIVLQSWTQDKIRVKAQRRVQAANAEEAKKLFSVLDFRYQANDRDVELSAEYGRGLEIVERLKERKDPHTSMDMQVFAPPGVVLKVWTLNGSVKVKNWNGKTDIRTATGDVQLEGIKSESVTLLCSSCSVGIRGLQGSVRCMGGSKNISLESVKGKQIYVESTTGDLKLKSIEGDQLYVTKSGAVLGDTLKGNIEFHSQAGRVELLKTDGFVSGRTDSGNIQINSKKWHFLDKGLIESSSGSIVMQLPGSFVGELDAWSVLGSTSLTFPVAPVADLATYGPEPISHVHGLVGGGGEQLKIFTQKGDIRINRAP